MRPAARLLLAVTSLAAVGPAAACSSSSNPSNLASHHRHVQHSRVATASSSPASGTTASASATAAPTATPSAIVTTVTGFQQFQSPTRNIGCEMDSTQARCDIKQRDWTPPPKPASCPVDYGQGLEVAKRGKGMVVCAGDTALDPKAQVIRYGHALADGPLRCTSEPSGMTCVNSTTGHGFFLARAGYRLF